MTEPSGSMPAGATSRATHVLPATLTPRPGESIESWLEHLAELNGLSTAAVLTMIRESGAHTRFLTIAPAPETVATVAAIARVSESEVYAATMATFDGTALDLTNLNPNNRDSYRQIAAPGWAPHRGTQICPRCLSERESGRAVGVCPSSPAVVATRTCCARSARRVNGRSEISATPTCASSAPAPVAATRSGLDRPKSAAKSSPTSVQSQPRMTY